MKLARRDFFFLFVYKISSTAVMENLKKIIGAQAEPLSLSHNSVVTRGDWMLFFTFFILVSLIRPYVSFVTSFSGHEDQYLGQAQIHPTLSSTMERLVFKNAVLSEHKASKMANLISRRQELKKCYPCSADNHFCSWSVSESAQSKLGRGWEWNQEVCQLANSAYQISSATQRIGHSKRKDQKCNTWQGSIKQ